MAMKTFEMNNKAYLTDEDTLDLLRVLVPSARESKDFSAVEMVMHMGLHTGRIAELEKAENG